MIIKNSNQATDVQKDSHVSWEGKKDSKRFYVKKTISYGVWNFGVEPTSVPNISWEGGTTQTFKFYRERTNSIREGFSSWTEKQKEYYNDATLYNDNLPSDCKINKNGYEISFTFGKRDETSSDRVFTICACTDTETIFDAYIKVTQTKRDKYVTKLDNAVITVDNIPASGGTVSSGKLTYRKTFNTGETENATENITFTTVSATTKGVTESGVTDVKTIAAGETNQKSTTIDGVTLTHPAFTVKQDANVKSVKTNEYKTTESVILSVSPTVVYSSGGTVTFSLSRKYTLHKTVYQYSSGSTSGGGTDTNQGPETVSANQTYTVSGISGTTSTTGATFKIGTTTSARTIKFQTTYDSVKSNEATVEQKLDGPDSSKAFYYTDLKITTFSYATSGNTGYHFPASGGTITSTNCTLKGTYIWHYTSMEGKNSQETVDWQLSDLTGSMYTFTPTSKSADSLGTTTTSANNSYATISVTVKNLKHTYDGKQYDVKNNSGTSLTASSSVTLTRQGNSGTQSTTESHAKLTVSVSPTSYDYKGGSATLTAIMTKTYDVTWTSGSTSTKDIDTTVTGSTTFTGTYTIGSSTTTNNITVSNASVTIPNLGTSKDDREYTFTGRYNGYTGTATLTQTGNTITYTVTFNINNSYAKWYRNGSAITDTTVTKKFSEGTAYTSLKPDETPTWISGSDYKYEFANNYSDTTTGSAVSISSTLTKDITLYARWTQATAYIKVTWDPNGGTLSASSGSGSTTSPIYYYYKSGSVQVSTTDAGYKVSPTKTNYSFVGWVDSDGAHTMPYTLSLSSAHKFTANFTTTSKTIYWNSNGGEWSSSPTTQRSTTANYGSSVSSYTPTPSKTSTDSTTYSFSGWSLTASGSTVSFPYTITTLNTTFNFYAKYSSSTRYYTVTWSNTYKGSQLKVFADDTYADKTTSVAYNTSYSSLTAPGTNSQVSVGGTTNSPNTVYQTAVWYDNNDFATKIANSSKKVTGNCTIYLKYTYVKHKLTLNSNNADFAVGTSTTKTYTTLIDENTSTLVSPSNYSFTNIPSGKEFIGWSKSSNATSAEVSSDTLATYFTISEPTTYYAIFANGSYTITWQAASSDVATSIWSDNTSGSKTTKASGGSYFKNLSAPTSFNSAIYNSTKTIQFKNGAWYDSQTLSTLLSNSTKTVTGNATVYAAFTVYYKVTFNGNNGTVSMNNSSSYTTYLLSVTYSSYSATRTGYDFVGWNTSSSASTGLTGTKNLTGTLTLYAIWSKKSYTATWTKNITQSINAYWSDGTSSAKTSTIYYGDSIKSLSAPGTLNSTVRSTDGTVQYTLNWYYQDNGSDFTLLSNCTSTVSSNITIYAMVNTSSTSNTRYRIRLYPNGGTLTISGTSYNPYTFYDYSYISWPTYTLTRTGYTANGWSTSSSASSGSTSFNISGALDLYAVWNLASYTITWTSYPSGIAHWSDGTSSAKTNSASYGTKYSALSAPATSNNTVYNSGSTIQYTSDGNWYTTTTGSTTISGNSTTVTGTLTVYKHFSTKYKVILDCNGGTISSNSSTTKWEFYTTSFSWSSYVPYRSGKTFKGWASSSSATSGSTSGTCTVSSSVTYYATWSTTSYTITWNNTNTSVIIWSDNSTGSKTSSAAYGTKYSALTAPATLANPMKNSGDTIRYTGAWYTASTGGTLLSSSSSTVTGNTNVYLQLTIASYKLVLNPNGGTLTVGSSSYTSSSPYTTYVKSINLGSYTPTRSGYNFKGWSTSSSATSGVTTTVTITSSTTYYGVWKQVFTVTWNLNGGTYNSSTTNPTQSVESGSTVSFSTYTPTRSGYTFQGWATSSSATSGSTSGNSSAITSNTTFYAIWKSATLTPILLILAS